MARYANVQMRRLKLRKRYPDKAEKLIFYTALRQFDRRVLTIEGQFYKPIWRTFNFPSEQAFDEFLTTRKSGKTFNSLDELLNDLDA